MAMSSVNINRNVCCWQTCMNSVDFKKKIKYKIGFSTFCELRPKWCVTVAVSGTHVVCVSLTHQNVKLMLPALIVCAVDAKDCMLH